MAQWQELLKLDSSIEIRHYLSDWIESQSWDIAASDEPTARTLLQTLLLKLDELRNESVHNINNTPFFQNHFETRPLDLAVVLSECLREEKNILASRLKDQVNLSTSNFGDDFCLLSLLLIFVFVKETEREIKSLEALNEKLMYIQRTWESQGALASLMFVPLFQVVVDQIVRSVNLATQIVQTLVSVELPEWKRRQQMSCIGKPVNTSLDQLEKWGSKLLLFGLPKNRKYTYIWTPTVKTIIRNYSLYQAKKNNRTKNTGLGINVFLFSDIEIILGPLSALHTHF
uniref:STAT transcription factor protein interaction domain-containing protein n=1 Tax=Neogobius melanostomus TaxID=47308 RepID=A0A8C6UJW1_9GOBI